MALAKETDYVARGLARLPQQFQGKPRIETLLSIWLGQCQELEDALWCFYESRLLQVLMGIGSGLAGGLAMGFGVLEVSCQIDGAASQSDLLDKIGKIVGQGRDGNTNGQYVNLIAARIKANRSDGRRETLIAILGLLAPSVPILVQEYQPATVMLEPQSAMQLSPYYIVHRFLGGAVAGGVKLYLVWTMVDASQTLTWSDSGGGVTFVQGESLSDSGGGFTGGMSAGVTSNQ